MIFFHFCLNFQQLGWPINIHAYVLVSNKRPIPLICEEVLIIEQTGAKLLFYQHYVSEYWFRVYPFVMPTPYQIKEESVPSYNISMVLNIFLLLSSLQKGNICSSSFEQNCIPYSEGCFVPHFVDLSPIILEKKIN